MCMELVLTLIYLLLCSTLKKSITVKYLSKIFYIYIPILVTNVLAEGLIFQLSKSKQTCQFADFYNNLKTKLVGLLGH